MNQAGEGPQLIDDAPPGSERAFLPGMGKSWLMRFYDPLSVLIGLGRRHRRLIELAELAAGQRLLDVGCGTGNLLQRVARTVPGLELAGLDPDRDSLTRAVRKLRRAGATSTLIHGYADHLPFDDQSLDRVVSSMALHHVDPDQRSAFAGEALRVLRPGGTVTVLDFSAPANGAGHDHQHRGLLTRRTAKVPQIRHNLGTALPELFSTAGFVDAREIDHEEGRLGSLTYVRAVRR